jgi:hypothetical protein
LERGGALVKYYTYVEPGKENIPEYYTYSESDIIDLYYDFWYARMCKKFGKEHVDKNYTKQDCIDDWVVINWAWESK